MIKRVMNIACWKRFLHNFDNYNCHNCHITYEQLEKTKPDVKC